MNLKKQVLKSIEDLDPEIKDSKLTLFFQQGEDIGSPYVVFAFAKSHRELQAIYKEQIGNPVIFGVVEKDDTAELYVFIKRVGENRWREFDILTKEHTRKVWSELKKIIEKIKEIHDDIERIDDPRLQEFISKMIDTERRVKEGGMLIAAYINYLERNIKDLENVIPRGWGGLVLQLMVMYFLHKRRNKLDALKFSIIEEYENYRRGKAHLDEEGYELWTILRDDLEKFEKISKDSLFSTKEYDMLKKMDFKIENKWFVGNAESLHTFKYENIKSVLKKFSRAIFESETKFSKAQAELWKKFEGLGILPLFEVRRWYEAGLVGDVIGGVYEGIKKIEERKKGGIYYTPRFIVEYIVDHTLEPYIQEILKEFGDYSEFKDFLNRADMKTLERFYARLTDIRILDPACGTGHFLVYAMEKLVRDYYYPLWERIQNLESGEFPVEVLHYDGENIKQINLNLREIDGDAVPFLIRTHLILKNNIYGVDIDDYAHRIAKARMIIDAFWNYNDKVRDERGIYALPNLEMNIKTGNSLIGFASWEEVSGEKRKTLFDFEGEPTKVEEIKKLMEEVKRTGNRENYEEIMATLRDKANELFVEYLAKKGVKIEKEKLGFGKDGLRAFHWIIEFPDVFEGDNPGFDIVVGNPPYGELNNIMEGDYYEHHRNILTPKNGIYKYHKTKDGKKINVYKVFIERTEILLRNRGYWGMIFPSPFLNDSISVLLRRRIFDNYNPLFILEFPEATKVFGESGVTQAVCVLIYKKESCGSEDSNIIKVRTGITQEELKSLDNLNFLLIDKNALKDLTSSDYVIPLIPSQDEWTILEYFSDMPKFSDFIDIKSQTKQGDINESKDKRFMSETPDEPEIMLIKGAHVERFYVNVNRNEPGLRWIKDFNKLLIKKKRIKEDIKEKRVVWRAVENKSHIPRLMFAQIPPNVVTGHSLYFIIAPEEMHYPLIALMNSKLLEWIFNRFSASNNITAPEVRRLPLLLEHTDVFSNMGKILSFIKYMNYGNILDYSFYEFYNFIKDNMIYELYFREKFHEDGLYPEPKNYLLEAVAKHLKPINYDRWAELYWKKQIEDALSEEEEAELERLEEENLKTIEEVYEALKNDEEVKRWIEKIKSHEWVRLIEEEK